MQLGDAESPTRTVVGVMPPLRPLEESWQAWAPIVLDPSKEELWSHNYSLRIHGRLRDGVSTEAAAAELRAVIGRIAAEENDVFLRNPESAAVTPLLEVLVGDLSSQLLLLAGAVALVLLAACANVATLLLTRGAARRRELAIRAAVGASRGRLVRQLLGEGALLGLAGGAAGLLLAVWLVDMLRAAPVELPRGDAVEVDLPVLAFALALGLAGSLLAGVVPALRASRADLRETLANGGRETAHRRLHDGLVTLEVALAVFLVVGAGLLLRSVWRLQQVDPGFRYESVLALRLSPPPSSYSSGAAITSYYESVCLRLANVPGVEAAGAAVLLPLAGGRMGVAFEIDGKAPSSEQEVARAEYNPAAGDYFQALGVPLLGGRWLEPTDAAITRPVPVLVNRAFQREFFPDGDPVGHRLTSEGEEWMRVVGVVGDVRQHQLDAAAQPMIYPPHSHDPMRSLYVAVRTSGDPSALTAAVAAAAAEVDALVPITFFKPMNEVVSRSMARARLFAGLLVGFAAVALALGTVGIYGVVSYGVSRRTREIGVRMALGADQRSVLREVIRGGLRPVALGLAVGLALAGFGGRLLAGYLYEVTSYDPATFGTVAAGVLLVGGAAALGPARRAARLDPIESMRGD